MSLESENYPVVFSRKFSKTAAQIAESAIAIIAREGFDHVSVRKVAQESGISAGTVQYHCATKEELLKFAFIRSIQRQAERKIEHSPEQTFEDILFLNLFRLLPTDEQGQEDAVAWVSFGAAASSRKWLSKLYWQAVELLRLNIQQGLEQGVERQVLELRAPIPVVAELLSALVNGLTLDFISAPDSRKTELTDRLRDGIRLLLDL